MKVLLQPKNLFLIAAVLASLVSFILWFGFREPVAAIFVGLWVPSILALGTLVIADRHKQD